MDVVIDAADVANGLAADGGTPGAGRVVLDFAQRPEAHVSSEGVVADDLPDLIGLDDVGARRTIAVRASDLQHVASVDRRHDVTEEMREWKGRSDERKKTEFGKPEPVTI